MKTIKEIANDCGLDGLRPTTLANILDGTYTGSTLYEESLYVIIAGQHRRIEKLEAEKAAAVDMLQSVSLVPGNDSMVSGNTSGNVADQPKPAL